MRLSSVLLLWAAGITGCQVLVERHDGGLEEESGDPGGGEVDVEIPATSDEVYGIQQGLVPPGSTVRLDEVVVTAVERHGLFVQEPRGGPYSGIYVRLGDPPVFGETWEDWYTRGDLVTVVGIVYEYTEDTQIYKGPRRTQIASNEELVWITGVGPEPHPVKLAPEHLAVPETAEPWQGVLVGLLDPFVQRTSQDDGEFLVWPEVRVEDRLHGFGRLYVGDRFEALVGVVDLVRGRHTLLPRDDEDFVGYQSEVLRLDDLRHGDLVLNELMVHSQACEGEAQYLEFFNALPQPIDLDGLVLESRDGTYVFQGKQVLPGGGLVLGLNAEAAACYGKDAHFEPTLRLGLHATERLTLFAGRQLVDEVDFGALSFPVGASLQLDPAAASATDNDDLKRWCPSTKADGQVKGPLGEDLGSPGFPNATACE